MATIVSSVTCACRTSTSPSHVRHEHDESPRCSVAVELLRSLWYPLCKLLPVAVATVEKLFGCHSREPVFEHLRCRCVPPVWTSAGNLVCPALAQLLANADVLD
mmetsp:Transcript_20370/g.54476  ORF Transcript_20370/g.54476 Transcript_20370/m.54476 type:complete len:104 (+) Transcript_20370:1461-1772(+)